MPKDCQIVLFSATFAPKTREFATRFAPNANLITLKQEELSVDGIKQFYMDCRDEEHKIEVLQAIYGLLTIGQSIIFVRVSYFVLLFFKFVLSSNHILTKTTTIVFSDVIWQTNYINA